MENKVFQEKIKKLNPNQRLAVETIEGPVMVIAGPGTGKTQTLILRIANILQKTQVNPENILALTFTENAVHEMRTRLLEIIGTQAYRISLYTFHAFATEVIRENPESFPRIIGRQPATDLDQILIIAGIVENGEYKFLRPFGDPMFYYKYILRAIDELKKDSISPDLLQQALTEERQELDSTDKTHTKGPHKGKVKASYTKSEKNIEKNLEVLDVYKKYEKSLHEQKLFDYNDMLLEVIQALDEDENLLRTLQEKYQYFLIDEHQDTNAAQNKIVERIASYFENPNLFVVGDEKQAIFRFQGASLENFLYFKNLYPKASLINLDINYRSNQDILDAASSMIKNNTKSSILSTEEFTLKSSRGKEKISVLLAETESYLDEYIFVASHIKSRIESGASPQEIAVLGRTNADLVPMIQMLALEGIEYTVETDQNILDEKEIQKLILLLELTQDPTRDDLLMRAMHIDFLKIEPLDVYRLRSFSKEKRISLWEAISRELYGEEITLDTKESLTEFYRKVIKWKTLSENEPLDDVFVKIVSESGFIENSLSKSNTVELLEKLTKLYDEIKLQLMKNPAFSLSDFLELITTVKSHNLSLRKSTSTRKNAVRLMTAHKAKGLEFEYVYILAARNGHWGNMRKKSSPINLPWQMLRTYIKDIENDPNEDERRLFYVALTRAKKEVVISYAKFGIDDRENLPSQFVDEIDPSLIEKIDTDKWTNEKKNTGYAFTSPISPTASESFLRNKTFFIDLFKKQGLSVSAINNFIECPWKYFFRNLLTLPDVKDQTLMFGTAVHYAINRYVKERASNENLDADNLISYYEYILNSLPLTEKEHNLLLEKGRETLVPYFNAEMKTWPKSLESELVINGVKFSEDVILTGRLDLLEKTGDDDEVIVHDFKTGAPKSRSMISTDKYGPSRNYKRQLVFYKILLDRYHNHKLKMKAGVIDFVQPNSSGNFKKEFFEITDNEVKELEEIITQVSKEILDLSFWDKRCDDHNCEYCRLRDFINQ